MKPFFTKVSSHSSNTSVKSLWKQGLIIYIELIGQPKYAPTHVVVVSVLDHVPPLLGQMTVPRFPVDGVLVYPASQATEAPGLLPV